MLNYILIFTILLSLTPKRLFSFTKLKVKRIEFILVSPLVLLLFFLSVFKQSYYLLFIALLFIVYFILFISTTEKRLFSNPIKQKLYNLGNFKKIKYKSLKFINLFFLAKFFLVFSLITYVLLDNITIPIVIFITIMSVVLYISKNVSPISFLPLQESVDYNSINNIKEYEPEIIFYFSASNKNFLYHITMWVPYLRKLNRKFYIMVREDIYIKELAALITDIPIVVALKLDEIEKFLPSSVKIALYANNGTKNTHLVRFNNITHIQLLHGDSEKPPSFNPVSKMYDKLFVSGQRAIDRYYENNVDIRKESFVIVGRPQISKIRKYYDLEPSTDFKTVLIAPTWVGFHTDSQFSSLMNISDLVDILLNRNEKIRIILRFHPLTKLTESSILSYIETLKNKLLESEIEHVFDSKNDIIDDFNNSDFIITDISSVPIDYLYSLKPIIHIDVNNLSKEFETNVIYKEYSKIVYLINEGMDNANIIFDKVLKDDYLLEKRKAIMKYYHGGSEELFYKEINKLLVK